MHGLPQRSFWQIPSEMDSNAGLKGYSKMPRLYLNGCGLGEDFSPPPRKDQHLQEQKFKSRTCCLTPGFSQYVWMWFWSCVGRVFIPGQYGEPPAPGRTISSRDMSSPKASRTSHLSVQRPNSCRDCARTCLSHREVAHLSVAFWGSLV